jgi:hypothetical protein
VSSAVATVEDNETRLILLSESIPGGISQEELSKLKTLEQKRTLHDVLQQIIMAAEGLIK